MSRLYYWNGGGYVNVPDGDRIRYWNGPPLNWVVPSALRYWSGSSWVDFWSKSNPVTVTFYPSLTTSLRWNGSSPSYDGAATSADNTKADMHNGRYNGSAPYHFTSMMHFRTGSNEGLGTMNDIFATRSVVKSASLRLHRVSGGLSSPVGDLRIGTWTQGFLETLPASNLDGRYHDWDPQTVSRVEGWAIGTNKTFPVNPATVYDMIFGNALMFAEVNSGYMSSGGTTSAYMRIYGLVGGNASLLPMLTVTFDIV